MPNANNDKPKPLKPPPTPQQTEAISKIGNLFKGREPQYMPVLKALETLGIEQRLMTITIEGDVTVECLVIPLQELIFKEWRQMSGATLQPQNERKVESE